MTTAYTQNKSPRLPDNHPEHVERILAKRASQDRWCKVSVVLTECLSWVLVIGFVAMICALMGALSDR